MLSDDVVYAIQTKLKADAAIIAVVGTRVHRRTLPAAPVFPAITVSGVSDIADIESSNGGYAHTRIQCTAWSISDGVTSNLSKLIRKSLHRTQNALLTAGTGKVYVVSIKDNGSVPDENTDLVPPLYMEHRDIVIYYDYR